VVVARGQLGNQEEGERPPLEAVTRGLMKIKHKENNDSVRAVVNCGLREIAIAL
jgi:hypothetical protein